MGDQKRHIQTQISSTDPAYPRLPGIILTICVCLLPFITISFAAPITDEAWDAFYLANDKQDFEQLCREIFLAVVAAWAIIWFIAERCSTPRRALPITRVSAAMFICLAGYLLLGLLSTIFSDYTMESWIGSYTLYEGYVALFSYGVVFAAAWYWMDRKWIIQFLQICLSILGIVLVILAILEMNDICYYNFALIQAISGINGTVSSTGDAVLTFGNADYLGLYCALLLPVQVGSLRKEDPTGITVLKLVGAVSYAVTLWLTHVSNTIVFGYGVTIALLVVWLLHSHVQQVIRIAVPCLTVLAIICGGAGFLISRDGDTFTEKLEHAVTGADLTDTYQLLSIDMDGDSYTFSNETTDLTVTVTGETLSSDTITFTCNGETVTPTYTDGTFTFSEEALSVCSATISDNSLLWNLGYTKEVETIWSGTSWTIVGLGGTELDEIPGVSDSEFLQTKYTYLNGRIFIWTNALSVLSDCIVLGHGTATAIYYLDQTDLPALLNIFGKYVVFNKPHSWYLQMGMDTGVISAVLVIAMLGIFFVSGAKQTFGKSRPWSLWRTGLWFGILAYALGGIFSDSLIYHAPMFWFIFGTATREMTVGLIDEQQE